jgi:hypothetical protein
VKITRRQLRKLLLTEIATGKNPYEFQKSLDMNTEYDHQLGDHEMINTVRYYFDTPTQKYKVIFNTGEDMMDGVVYNVAFSTLKQDGEHVVHDIDKGTQEFGDEYNQLSSLTGELDLRVFNTIIAIVNDFIVNTDRSKLYPYNYHLNDRDKTVRLSFKGTSSSRDKLYYRLLDRNISKLPGVNFEINDWTGEFLVMF